MKISRLLVKSEGLATLVWLFLTLLAKLNRIMFAAKHVDPQIPFGGVNVIIFGDYLQYRPVLYAVAYRYFFTLKKSR